MATIIMATFVILGIFEFCLFVFAFVMLVQLREKILKQDKHLSNENMNLKNIISQLEENHRKTIRKFIMELLVIAEKDSWIDMQNAVKHLINKKDAEIERTYQR